MDIKSIIKRKREREELTEDEIKYFIGKYTKGEINDAQASALLSYIYINGLTENELVFLCKEMANSGEKFDLGDISKNIVDKHSTGGVGDKATIILMPVIASLGIPVAKISSRGYGISGGTIDKLESIPGFDTELSIGQLKNIINNIGVGIVSQSFNFAPAENKMYKLRNQIGCSDSLPLIAASLMSLKLASGSDKIVFDITCGRGTYIKSKEEAKKLSKILIKLGKRFDKQVGCVITAMDEPLGYAIGHNLEIEETINALKGKMPEDLGDVVVALGSLTIALVTGNKNMLDNSQTIKEVIRTGKAYEKFREMVSSQYGNVKYIDNPELFKKAKYIMPVYSTEEGFVESIDADFIGSIAVYLGAGRMKDESEINRTAGIVLNKKIGDEVKSGEILAYVHTDDEKKALSATQNLKEAFKFTNKKIQVKSRVLDVIQ